MIPEKLLEILKCPACRGDLAYVETPQPALVCKNAECRRSYGVIKDKIPNMLEEESAVLGEAAWKSALDAAGDPEA